MQAISGAGYDGVASMAILDNVIPYIEKKRKKLKQKQRSYSVNSTAAK